MARESVKPSLKGFSQERSEKVSTGVLGSCPSLLRRWRRVRDRLPASGRYAVLRTAARRSRSVHALDLWAGARVRRVLLAGLLLLALALGVGGGYYTGDRLDAPEPTASGTAGPLGTVSESPSPTPTEPSLPVKTPVPSNLEPLQPGLDYTRRSFTVTPQDEPSVQLSIEIPQGWKQTRDPKRPQEVKYLDDQKERGVRIEAVEPVDTTPAAAMAQLIVDLKKSQAPENDVRIVSHTTGQINGEDGDPRPVATLIYTYIPGETLRYVIVRWIAIDGQLTNVEMSITGIPEDAAALDEVLQRTSTSVHQVG